MKAYALSARSKIIKKMKNGKPAIKITWFDRNGKKLSFDGVEIQRSTKRYSGFTKFFESKTGRYYDTKIHSGNRYFYRVRGYIDFNGEKIYTSWSYKAIRKWKK